MKTYIVDAVRTHVGRYGGALAEARPDDLAAVTLSSIVERSAIKASDVDEVILGAANQSGDAGASQDSGNPGDEVTDVDFEEVDDKK